MKKTTLLFLILFLSVFAFGQKKQPFTAPTLPMDNETKLVSYNGVVDQSGIVKSELYKRAMKWIKEYYPNPTGIVQESDSVAGKIVCKARFDARRTLKNGQTAPSDRVQYTLTILLKDGKYKYELTNINIKAPSYLPIEKYFDEKAENAEDHFNTLNQADETFSALVHSLKDRMDQPSEKVKKDDW